MFPFEPRDQAFQRDGAGQVRQHTRSAQTADLGRVSSLGEVCVDDVVLVVEDREELGHRRVPNPEQREAALPERIDVGPVAEIHHSEEQRIDRGVVVRSASLEHLAARPHGVGASDLRGRPRHDRRNRRGDGLVDGKPAKRLEQFGILVRLRRLEPRYDLASLLLRAGRRFGDRRLGDRRIRGSRGDGLCLLFGIGLVRARRGRLVGLPIAAEEHDGEHDGEHHNNGGYCTDHQGRRHPRPSQWLRTRRRRRWSECHGLRPRGYPRRGRQRGAIGRFGRRVQNGLSHLGRRRKAVVRALVRCPGNDRKQCELLQVGRKLMRIGPHLGRDLSALAGCRHNRLSGQALGHNQAQCVEVDPPVCVFEVLELLGCHIARCTDGKARLGLNGSIIAGQLGYPEVQYLHCVVGAGNIQHHDVVGLEIAMHDAHRVSLFERPQDLVDDACDLSHCERSIGDHATQRPATHELQGKEGQARFGSPVVQNPDRGRMVQTFQDQRFLLETTQPLFTLVRRGEMGDHDLDGDVDTQPDLGGAENDPEAPAAELFEELKAPHRLAEARNDVREVVHD